MSLILKYNNLIVKCYVTYSQMHFYLVEGQKKKSVIITTFVLDYNRLESRDYGLIIFEITENSSLEKQ